jgi:predicted secreted protein
MAAARPNPVFKWLPFVLIGLVVCLWILQFFLPDQGVGFVTGIVVFLIVWWMVFFTVLPLGVRSQQEEGDIVPGSEPGAPGDPRLKWKMALTTTITSGLWLVYFVAFEFGFVTLDLFPGASPAS